LRARPPLAVVILLALVMPGCSAGEARIEADRAPTPAPTGRIIAQQAADGAEGIIVSWLADSTRVTITTLGSSSCPLVPLRIAPDHPDVLILDRDTAGSSVCSADLNPTSSTLERPEGWTPDSPMRAEYRDNDVLLFPVPSINQ
jgi:hypothetical protein